MLIPLSADLPAECLLKLPGKTNNTSGGSSHRVDGARDGEQSLKLA